MLLLSLLTNCSDIPLHSAAARLKQQTRQEAAVKPPPSADSRETLELLPLKEVKLRYIFSGEAYCGTDSAMQQEVVLLTPKDSSRFANAYQHQVWPLDSRGEPDPAHVRTIEGEWQARKGTADRPNAIVVDLFRGPRSKRQRVASYEWAVAEHTLTPLEGAGSKPKDRALRQCRLRLRRTEELF